MKKISTLIALAIIFSILTMTTVSAVEPQWVYESPKLVIPVTVDGKVDGNEWDDVEGFTANNDSPVFKQFGVWQVNADMPIPSSELSVDYKIKWDDTNLYILEKRFDKNYVVFPDYDEDANKWPWTHSGTLFFLTYSEDYANPTTDGCYEVFWVNNGTTLLVTGRHAGKAQMYAEDPELAGVTVAGSKDGETYYTEVAIPWATMATVSGFPTPSEGLKMRMTPIVSAYHVGTGADVADRNQPEAWNQLNFYCDPEVGAADDPNSNGGMVLVASTYTPPAPEPEPTEAAAAGGGEAADAEVAPAVQAAVATAPQTGDSSMGIIIFVIALLGSAVVISRKRIAQK